MSRDISTAVPDDIATRIIGKWGKHETFVEATGIGYDAVYSLLVRTGGKGALKLIEKIAEAFGCTEEEAAKVFELEVGAARRAAFQKLAGDQKLSNISKTHWGYESALRDIINGKSGTKHVPNLLAVLKALDLDLEAFKQDYKKTGSAA